jgi:hypothetical protein
MQERRDDEDDEDDENTIAGEIEEGNENDNSDWSKWSITLPINGSGAYRILARAIDGAGNENWDESRIIVPYVVPPPVATVSDSKKAIALVDPTFTETAYSDNAFYTFYQKHQYVLPGQNIVDGVEMLTASIPQAAYFRPESVININNLTIFSPADPDNEPIITLGNHLQNLMPDYTISVIRDEDIHNGYIFVTGQDNSQNAYDMLIVFHDEYVTQEMYNNYKRFVSNGGNILFMNGNVLFAEVKYNQENNTISLIRGHGWEFDGKSAKRGIEERWFNENKEFVGSNFLLAHIDDNITFRNNPFNYTHFEENFVNNDKAKILIDYGVILPHGNHFPGSKVATYELDHNPGGKIIMIGLFGQKLIHNTEFLNFLDSMILNNLK